MSIARTWNFVNTLLCIHVFCCHCIIVYFNVVRSFDRKSEINHQFSLVQFSSLCWSVIITVNSRLAAVRCRACNLTDRHPHTCHPQSLTDRLVGYTWRCRARRAVAPVSCHHHVTSCRISCQLSHHRQHFIYYANRTRNTENRK